MKTISLAALAAALLAGARPQEPWTGEPAVQETVDQIMARSGSEPAIPLLRGKPQRYPPTRHALPQNAEAPAAAQWPPEGAPGATAAAAPRPTTPQAVSTSFLGAQLSESGFIPPDSMGAAGPTQFLVTVNGRIKVFSKAGALGALNVSTDTFFASVRNGSSTSDPTARFDRLTSRWFVSIINVAATSNRILLAVSDGPTITGGTVWSFFFFQQDTVAPAGDTNLFADFPRMGVDANAVYIGANMFTGGGAFQGTTGWVIRKTSVTGGGPIVVTAFRQISTAAGPGPFAPHGVDNDDPAATQGYFIGVDTATFGTLMIRRISTPGGTPTISGNLSLPVPSTAFPINVPAQGSTHALDGIDDRLSGARLDGGSLWTCHNIQVNAAGVASGSGGRNGARWYQINNLTGAPALVQSGTLFDPSAANPRSFWVPSCATTGQGHMGLGCSAAGNAERAEIAVAGRLAGDALGTIQAPTTAVASATNYNVEATTPQRWGDFSKVTVDPADNMTLWTAQEYCNGTNSWGVQVIKLLAPPPATPASCAPAALGRGSAGVNVTITGTSSAGSGFYDPGAGFPNRLSASVTGGVTVNSVTFTDPTHMTIKVTVPGGASLGAQSITVTNPDGQTATGVGLLTLTGGPPAVAVAANAPSAGYLKCGATGLEGIGVLALVALGARARRPKPR